MRWPWSSRAAPAPERRASYTDSVVEALAGGADGAAQRHAHATAALEACAALYAAAFARCNVEGAPSVAPIAPSFLALVARDLIRRGESVFHAEIEAGMVELRPAGSWDVRGPWREAEWLYRLDLFGPSGNITRYVPGAAVLHFRYATDPARPWLGIGPMQWATATGALAGRLESGLADEAGAPSAQLLPVPTDGGDGGDDDPLAKLKGDIGKAKGKPVLVETTAAGWGEGMGAAPRRDWAPTRLGFNPPDVLRTLRDDAFQHVAAACNVPGVLLDPRAEGTSQREGLRRFAHLALEPLGTLVAAELAAKLEAPELTLDFAPLMASDLAGKARAIKGLVEAGIDLSAAVMVAGLGDA